MFRFGSLRRDAWLLAALLPLTLETPAHAAGYSQVQNFGSNPSNLNMYTYVPTKLGTPPAVVVAIHYCGGSAQAFYTGPGSGLVTAANQYGYIVIFPETVSTTNNKCWDVYSNATFTHNGGSDSAGIISMVKYVLSTYSADASRVYAMGTSSGAMMTQVLLGAYPDVFKAGSAWSGVPFGCFAGSGYWNSACAQGQTSKTGAQWGDLVRAAYPGYSGARPRIQLWHGDVDDTINFNNFNESIKQWTNVLGVSATPTTTEQNTPQSGYTRTRYNGSCGPRVEAVKEAGQGHNLSVLASEVVRFFGLDKTTDPDASCNSGGSGGASSTGGSSSSGGASNSGGTASSGGANSGGRANGGTTSAGGTVASGGAASGGRPNSGGSSNGGSTSNSGGTSSNGGASSNGGSSASGGSASGGTTGTGGTTAAGGTASFGGASSNGGAQSLGGSASGGSNTAGSGGTAPSDGSCSCSVVGAQSRGAHWFLPALAALGLARLRRRSRRR
ncbi:MAG: PHB depolymerase family esterase [Polyangiaceae bacterium]